MNFKYVTCIAATLIIGMSSCSNEDEKLGTGTEGQPATLNLTLVDNGSNNAMTYAPGDGKPGGATEGATASESTVNAANQHVYIFNAAGQLEVTGSSLTGLSLTSGPKKIYLIANIAGPLPFATFVPTVGNAAATEANLLAEDFTLTTPAIGDLTAANNFYITNVGGPGVVNIAPGSNSMNLSIGRGVAKVNIDMTQATSPATGTLSGAKYLIANNPADMFYVPNYSAGQLQTPYFNTAAGASAYFDNGTVTATAITSGLLNADGDKGNMSYTTENAIATAHISYSTISYAIIEGVFAPNAVVDVTNTASTYTAGDDFYRIQYIETVGSEKYDRGYYTAFIVGAAAPVAGDQVVIDANTVMPAAAHGGTVAASICTYKGDAATGATCYYYLGLGDSRITTAGQETARFTVERNKYYYYEVASVADCGAHTPVPPVTIPPMTSTLDINFATGPWGVVGGAGGLNPGI